MASGILPDVEDGILPPGRNVRMECDSGKFQRIPPCVRFFPPGWEARLYGSQGWPPLRSTRIPKLRRSEVAQTGSLPCRR
ncbi:MAG TPA: hypothetical protein PKA41_19575, partial [Verrucomicrobiota bacterium]|nr:hypothetical protein [Verrucomicrobiota bacterium]